MQKIFRCSSLNIFALMGWINSAVKMPLLLQVFNASQRIDIFTAHSVIVREFLFALAFIFFFIIAIIVEYIRKKAACPWAFNFPYEKIKPRFLYFLFFFLGLIFLFLPNFLLFWCAGH